MHDIHVECRGGHTLEDSRRHPYHDELDVACKEEPRCGGVCALGGVGAMEHSRAGIVPGVIGGLKAGLAARDDAG
jgi:hypothetical protein